MVIAQKNGAVRVTVEWDQPAIRGLAKRGGMVDRYVRGKASEIASVARRIVPVRSGVLRGSIRVQQSRDVGGRFAAGYDVAANAAYARFVHDGTKPHVIVPRNASVLAFQVGGTTVFARRVNHPGTKAQPFLTNAAREVISRTQ